jgi:hypothetical protein
MLLLFSLLTLLRIPVVASAAVDSCPGYAASNVQSTDNSLTASLNLAGEACNTYGEDIQNLTLSVEYQSGKFGRHVWVTQTIVKDSVQ